MTHLRDATIQFFGACGPNAKWTLDTNGLLMITGNGLMYDYCSSMPQWYKQRERIKSVYIVEGITSVGASAFLECSSLREIVIPRSATYIGNGAFFGCSSLEKLRIPLNINRIDPYVFYGCGSLASVSVDPGNMYFSSADGVLFDKSANTLVYYPADSQRTSYEIPKSVRSVAMSAFSNCTMLSEVTIPASVTTIGDGAFSGCTALEKISIPRSCKVINAQTFYGCTSLVSVRLTNKLSSVFEGAFEGCSSLEKIYFMGDESEWNSISFSEGWDIDTGNYTVEFIVGINYGDANEDGSINAKDLLKIKKYLASYDYDTGTSSEEVGEGADANGDGAINAKDLLKLKKYLASYDYDTGTSTEPLGPT